MSTSVLLIGFVAVLLLLLLAAGGITAALLHRRPRCPRCGKALQPHYQVCPYCGAPLAKEEVQ